MDISGRPHACWAVCLALICSAAARAQDRALPIWSGAAPGSEGWTQKEVEYLNGKQKMVRNIVTPTLTVFPPQAEKANGAAVIVCPGGGFRFLSWENEGTKVAQWLAERGVAAFVLKYRLVDTGATEEQYQKAVGELFARIRSVSEAPAGAANTDSVLKGDADTDRVRPLAVADGRQAVKFVREHAAEWNVKPDRVGIMGFSAGAMVTTGVLMEHDKDSRPDFAAAIYGGSTRGGEVPADGPPLFILCASDDALAARGAAKLYLDWRTAGLPAEIHIYAKGGHGFGMAKRGLPVDHWTDRLGEWMEGLGLIKAPATGG